MIVAIHATMGALVGEKIASPVLAFCLGLASHFLLDVIPHGDSKMYHDYKNGVSIGKSLAATAIDVILSVAIFIYFIETARVSGRASLVTAMIGGIIPDFLVALGEGVRIRPLQWFQRLHISIHDAIVSRTYDLPFRLGIYLQLMLLAGLFWAIRK